ncbi:uncharacterized protein A4U43_C07F5860 [Asparagus officinalis]|uniref:Uncharacterized protein n=1 Tax=Asparagus officinalis TaxID=4686 RepID=A0A5P1EBN5_ASPOF|nr:uncharacterized protein A4U43_C07F5860 [Asparagus officinalis]
MPSPSARLCQPPRLLDALWSDSCQAGPHPVLRPQCKFNRNAEWRSADGQSEINAEGLSRFIGWVSSSKGNLTTISRQKLKFKSQVEVQNRGEIKRIELNNKGRSQVEVVKSHQTLARVQLLMEAPLQVQTTSMTAAGGAVFQKSRLFHQLEEIVNLSEGQAMTTSQLTDRQDAEGSALMHEGTPVWGSGTTRSQYKYRDESTCYLRAINTAGGLVMVDTKSATCANIAEA